MAKEMIAMLLAGGQGSRLYALTQKLAKPAVPFGGKYRIIDFPLSNCVNSGIDTVGILTQYQPMVLNEYIGNGQPWDLDRLYGGVHVLPPYQKASGSDWYKGTANAIYQNIPFIERYDPQYVIILSGDQICKQDYSDFLRFHKEKGAEFSVAVMEVPWDEASRFGLMVADGDDRITEFQEKPENPKSNLASMGIYIFNWDILKKYLEEDEAKIYSRNSGMTGHKIGSNAVVENSMITDGCRIDGSIKHSILFSGVRVEKGAKIEDAVVMGKTVIKAGAVVEHCIVAENVVIGENAVVGSMPKGEEHGVATIGSGITIGKGAKIGPNAMVNKNVEDGEEQW